MDFDKAILIAISAKEAGLSIEDICKIAIEDFIAKLVMEGMAISEAIALRASQCIAQASEPQTANRKPEIVKNLKFFAETEMRKICEFANELFKPANLLSFASIKLAEKAKTFEHKLCLLHFRLAAILLTDREGWQEYENAKLICIDLIKSSSLAKGDFRFSAFKLDETSKAIEAFSSFVELYGEKLSAYGLLNEEFVEANALPAKQEEFSEEDMLEALSTADKVAGISSPTSYATYKDIATNKSPNAMQKAYKRYVNIALLLNTEYAVAKQDAWHDLLPKLNASWPEGDYRLANIVSYQPKSGLGPVDEVAFYKAESAILANSIFAKDWLIKLGLFIADDKVASLKMLYRDTVHLAMEKAEPINASKKHWESTQEQALELHEALKSPSFLSELINNSGILLRNSKIDRQELIATCMLEAYFPDLQSFETKYGRERIICDPPALLKTDSSIAMAFAPISHSSDVCINPIAKAYMQHCEKLGESFTHISDYLNSNKIVAKEHELGPKDCKFRSLIDYWNTIRLSDESILAMYCKSDEHREMLLARKAYNTKLFAEIIAGRRWHPLLNKGLQFHSPA